MPATPSENVICPPFDARELVASLPHRPGVYRMFDAAGATLYVGKARDLKKRVASYFQKGAHETRIAVMLSQVARVETTVTRSEGEALLLENNLIKADEPRYNILFRDDKSYPYVCLTGEAFPQLAFHRGKLDRQHRYFGPFPSAGAVREGMALLQKVFQLRTCENSVFANRSRPCMLHQIARCSAPCVGLVTAADYAGDVQGAVLFLQGKTTEVLAQLKAQMDAASAALEFERAARIRDKVTRLTGLQSRQFVESATAGDIDVVAAAAAEGQVAVNVVMVRGGRHVGDRSYFPRHADAGAISEVVPAFLAQHYVGRPVPPTIIAAGADEQTALADVLSAQAGQRVQIVGNPGGERRVWLAMAVQNAEFAIRQKLAQKATQEDRLAALQKALGLPAEAQRIECFDVSHTMGERAVASCVIFDRLAMQTAEYRRFNVTPPAGGDDYAAMREALDAPLRADRRRRVPGARSARRRRRQGAGRGRGRGARGAGAARHAADRHRQGTRTQGRRGRHRVSGRRPRAEPCRRPSGTPPAAADPRRGAPVRDPGPPRAPRQGAHDVVAAGDRRHRRQEAPGAARALRRPQGRAGGERRRSHAGAGREPRARGEDLHGAALTAHASSR